MLFWILFIIFIIYYVNKKKKMNDGKAIPNQPRTSPARTAQQLYEQYANQAPYASQAQPQTQRTMTPEDRQRLEAYRAAKATQNGGATAAGYPVKQQPKNVQPKQDILSKAQKNAKKYENDTTLEQLEHEHNHSEQVKATISKEALQQKKEMHPHDASHVSQVVGEESDSILGTIEDLMVKGYDGNLSFERDFIGEAMDMISHFSVPDSIPDTTK